MLAAGPGTPVAVNVAGVATPDAVAVIVLACAVVLVVKEHCTRPLAFVVVVQLERVPLVFVHVTVAPGTTLELASWTRATRAEDRAEPALTDWLLPEFTEMLAGLPGVMLKAEDVIDVTPVAEAVKV